MTYANPPASRREFLALAAGLAAGAAAVPATFGAPEADDRAGAAPGGAAANDRWTAAVIGHTGRGDYGHGLDVVFKSLAGVEVVALADAGADATARLGAAARAGAPRHYADYREMLEKEKPRLVSIAPRWTDQHHPMAMAALAVGAHLVTEKPFMQTLTQADEVLAAADAAGGKIAVAHQMRLAPAVARLKRAVDEGLLGDLLQIDSWGKQDARAGGEDMLVLGTHLFDLMRLFAGDARSCTARVLQAGRDVTRADARRTGEDIGPVAGDEVFAQFAFERGVNATFNSRGKMRERTGHWGIELVGSKGSARLLADIDSRVFVMKHAAWTDAGRSDMWQPLEAPRNPGAGGRGAAVGGVDAANRRVVQDWLDAIRTNREPACSGHNGAKAIEMVMAVYRAALAGGRVTLPLNEREHPLGEL
jgi:predicted dehydrogenase